jgi:hypothetical protein
VEGTVIRAVILAASLALLASCASDRAGWGRRGRSWKLEETPALQVRRGPQVLDPATGELRITWLGVRAPDGEPPILGCELTVFDDRNGNGSADAGEIVCVRESNEKTSKILFDEVRARVEPKGRLRAKLVVRTENEIREVTWSPAAD